MARPCHRQSTCLLTHMEYFTNDVHHLLLYEFQYIPSLLDCLGPANRTSKGDNLHDLSRSILILRDFPTDLVKKFLIREPILQATS
jgi:hypothetical protein